MFYDISVKYTIDNPQRLIVWKEISLEQKFFRSKGRSFINLSAILNRSSFSMPQGKRHYLLNRFRYHWLAPLRTITFARYTESRDLYRNAEQSRGLTDVVGINSLLLFFFLPFPFSIYLFVSLVGNEKFPSPFYTDWSILFSTLWKLFSTTSTSFYHNVSRIKKYTYI